MPSPAAGGASTEAIQPAAGNVWRGCGRRLPPLPCKVGAPQGKGRQWCRAAACDLELGVQARGCGGGQRRSPLLPIKVGEPSEAKTAPALLDDILEPSRQFQRRQDARAGKSGRVKRSGSSASRRCALQIIYQQRQCRAKALTCRKGAAPASVPLRSRRPPKRSTLAIAVNILHLRP